MTSPLFPPPIQILIKLRKFSQATAKSLAAAEANAAQAPPAAPSSRQRCVVLPSILCCFGWTEESGKGLALSIGRGCPGLKISFPGTAL